MPRPQKILYASAHSLWKPCKHHMNKAKLVCWRIRVILTKAILDLPGVPQMIADAWNQLKPAGPPRQSVDFWKIMSCCCFKSLTFGYICYAAKANQHTRTILLRRFVLLAFTTLAPFFSFRPHGKWQHFYILSIMTVWFTQNHQHLYLIYNFWLARANGFYEIISICLGSNIYYTHSTFYPPYLYVVKLLPFLYFYLKLLILPPPSAMSYRSSEDIQL